MADGIQRLLAGALLVIVAPLVAILAAVVRSTSDGPALHRAERVGRGRTFTLYKLRTMRADAPTSGTAITAADDPRVTRFGRLLRRTKLDEFPQLWNVVRGEMLLVGPRAEDPRYVDCADPLHRVVFESKPGITGPTALAFRDEERLLRTTAMRRAAADGREAPTDEDIDGAYREEILPAKLAMDAEYLRTRSTRGDLAILVQTVGLAIRRPERDADRRR